MGLERAAFVATCFLALPMGLAAQGRVLRVPSQYKTVQAAIDAAKNGDTVLVAPGLYRENIRVLKNIVVRSSGGAQVTTLAAASRGPVVTVAGGATPTIEGFTITGGSGVKGVIGSWRGVFGGGVYTQYSSPVIRRNIITGNAIRDYDGRGAQMGGASSPRGGRPESRRTSSARTGRTATSPGAQGSVFGS